MIYQIRLPDIVKTMVAVADGSMSEAEWLRANIKRPVGLAEPAVAGTPARTRRGKARDVSTQ